jgi:hypothetical protein
MNTKITENDGELCKDSVCRNFRHTTKYTAIENTTCKKFLQVQRMI